MLHQDHLRIPHVNLKLGIWTDQGGWPCSGVLMDADRMGSGRGLRKAISQIRLQPVMHISSVLLLASQIRCGQPQVPCCPIPPCLEWLCYESFHFNITPKEKNSVIISVHRSLIHIHTHTHRHNSGSVFKNRIFSIGKLQIIFIQVFPSSFSFSLSRGNPKFVCF